MESNNLTEMQFLQDNWLMLGIYTVMIISL